MSETGQPVTILSAGEGWNWLGGGDGIPTFTQGRLPCAAAFQTIWRRMPQSCSWSSSVRAARVIFARLSDRRATLP
jgi:hypothetical protein